MKAFLKKVYDARFFWIHLARIELKNKFRRSKLGLIWTFLSPLCLTGIMSVVFSVAFHQDIVTYAPYILSGILVWELVSSSFVAGSSVIISNDAYIRQFNHPITIYSLKSAVVYTLSFMLASISLMVWIFVVSPRNLVVGLLSLPLTVVLLFFFAWGATTISAYTATKYRDYPQMMPLILQAVWYVSPVFLQESMFTGNRYLSVWFNINPVTHVLNLVRKPFLYGLFPGWVDYLFTLGVILVVGLIAYRINKRNEKNIIFYI